MFYVSHCVEPEGCQEGGQKKEHTNNPRTLANEEQRGVHDGELLRWRDQDLALVSEGVDVCDHHGGPELGHGHRAEGGEGGEDGKAHFDCLYEVLGDIGERTLVVQMACGADIELPRGSFPARVRFGMGQHLCADSVLCCQKHITPRTNTDLQSVAFLGQLCK